MAYCSDVFISYRRRGDVEQWVQLHFMPRLRQALYNRLAHEPQLWIDVQQEEGTNWPDNIKDALRNSKLLMAVWSPDYFRSKWCMAEWQSMVARQAVVAANGEPMPPSLVYPVKYSDGENFHPDAKVIQCRADLSRLNYPYETFRDSPRYMDFHDLVEQIADDLARWLGTVPPWREDWPLAMPAAMDPAPISAGRSNHERTSCYVLLLQGWGWTELCRCEYCGNFGRMGLQSPLRRF